jgi:very-short-patch-repair endonuclease
MQVHGEGGKRWSGVAVTGHAKVSAVKAGRARELRRRQTKTEAAVWELLRRRRILDLKFRRQQPIPTA